MTTIRHRSGEIVATLTLNYHRYRIRRIAIWGAWKFEVQREDSAGIWFRLKSNCESEDEAERWAHEHARLEALKTARAVFDDVH